eukprot:COSAG03_NODE_7169_length_954_cov_2.602339_2_plen_136_part_00
MTESEEGSGPAAAAQARSHAGLALGRGQATAATTRARMASFRVSQGRAPEERKGALCFRLRNPGLAVDRWHIADDRDTEQQQIHSALRNLRYPGPHQLSNRCGENQPAGASYCLPTDRLYTHIIQSDEEPNNLEN